MFWNKETIYTDVLEEWRKVKILDFNLFDKMIIDGREGIFLLVGLGTNSIYTDGENYKGVEFYRNGRIRNEGESYEKCVYDSYQLMGLDTVQFVWDNPKRYYGEFQQEFESLDKAVKDEEILKSKIEEIKSLEKSINENYNKARLIQGKNYKELGII